MNRRHQYAAAAGCWSSAGAAATMNAELWRALARYRQIGAAGLLTADRPRGTTFGRQHELAREAVLHPADRYPAGVLGEFEQLAQLLELLGDRLAFLCSWLLEFFLDPKPRLASEADHLQVTLEVLQQKLAEEDRTAARDLRPGALPVAP